MSLFMPRAGSQATVILVMLILEFGLDCQGVDLLSPLNRQLSKVLSRVAPPRMDRMPLPLPPRMHRAALLGDARVGVERIPMHEQLRASLCFSRTTHAGSVGQISERRRLLDAAGCKSSKARCYRMQIFSYEDRILACSSSFCHFGAS